MSVAIEVRFERSSELEFTISDFTGVAKAISVFISLRDQSTCADRDFIEDLLPQLTTLHRYTFPAPEEIELVFHLFVDLLEQTREGHPGNTKFVFHVQEEAKVFLGVRHIVVHKLRLLVLCLNLPLTTEVKEYADVLVREGVMVHEEDEEHVYQHSPSFRLCRSEIVTDEIDLDDEIEADPIRDIRYAYATALLLCAENNLGKAEKLLRIAIDMVYWKKNAEFRHRRNYESEMHALNVRLHRRHAQLLVQMSDPDRAVAQLHRCALLQLEKQSLVACDEPFKDYAETLTFDTITLDYLESAFADEAMPDFDISAIVTHVLAIAQKLTAKCDYPNAVTLLDGCVTALRSRFTTLYGGVPNMTGNYTAELKMQFNNLLRANLDNVLKRDAVNNVNDTAIERSIRRTFARLLYLTEYVGLLVKHHDNIYYAEVGDMLTDVYAAHFVYTIPANHVMCQAVDFLLSRKHELPPRLWSRISGLAGKVAFIRDQIDRSLVFYVEHQYEALAHGHSPPCMHENRIKTIMNALSVKVTLAVGELSSEEARHMNMAEQSIATHVLAITFALRHRSSTPTLSKVPTLAHLAAKVLVATRIHHVSELRNLVQQVPVPSVDDLEP